MASGLTFTSDKAPAPGVSSLTLTVSNGPSFVWVMGGVGNASVINWKGNASVKNLGGGWYSWTFSDIPLPGGGGPYTFHFRKDAVNDNPSLGTEVARCTP